MARASVEPRQMLQYIGDMLEELLALTPQQGGSILPYLIDMARLETREAIAKLAQPGSDTRPPG